MTYRDLAIAAMDNQRMAHNIMINSRCRHQWAYWADVAAQAQRELHVYLNWMIHHTPSEDLRPAIPAEGLQSPCV